MSVYCAVVADGMRVVVEKMADRDLAAFNVRVSAGWMHERPNESGIAHLAEHMLFHGTEQYPSHALLTGQVESLGGRLTGGTTADYTSLWSSGPADQAEHLIEPLIEMLLSPRFDRQAIEKERLVLTTELETLIEDPVDWAVHSINGVLWPGHLLDEDPEGALRALPRLSRQQLVAFHRRRYQPANMVIAAGGRVEPAWLCDLLAKRFRPGPAGRNARPPALPKRTKPNLRLLHLDGSVDHVLLAFPAPSYGSADRPAMEILQALLGSGMNSLLFQKLRVEEAIIYHLETFYDKFAVAGVLGIYFECSSRRLERVVRTILSELDRIRKEGVNAPALAQAKSAYVGEQLYEYDSLPGRVKQLAVTTVLAGQTISCEQDLASLKEVSTERLAQVAQKYLFAQGVGVCLRGNLGRRPDLERRLATWIESEL